MTDLRPTPGDLLASVPSIHERPHDAGRSLVAISNAKASRRSVLRVTGGVLVAAGLATFEAMPWSKPQSAAALDQWGVGDCRGYFNSSSVCVPSNAYYNSQNCSGSWHKNEGRSGTCYNYRYTPNATSCDGRNAWRWTGRTARRKCSDGWYSYNDCTGGRISSFSICRTAI